MSNNTYTPQLEVTRDGQLDLEYQRKQLFKARVARARDRSIDMTYTMLEAAHRAATPVILDYKDWVYGTKLRDEYFNRQKQAAIASLRQTYLA